MEKTPLRFIWHYFKKFRVFILGICFFVLISVTAGRYSVLYSSKLFDAIALKTGAKTWWSDIYFIIFMIFALDIIRSGAHQITNFFASKVMPKLNTMAVRDCFDYVNKHSIAFFNQEMSGNISNKISQISVSLRTVLEAAGYFAELLFTIIVTTVMISSASIYYLAFLVVWTIVMSILTIRWANVRRERSRILGDIISKNNGMIVDSLSNYSEIKSFANFKFERRRLSKNLRFLRIAEIREMMVFLWYRVAQSTSIAVSTFLLMLLSVWLFQKGEIDVTYFIFANVTFSSLYRSIMDMGYAYNNIAKSMGTLQSALDTISVEPEIRDKPDALNLEIKKAAITFDNVSFAYKGKDNLFNHLSIDIKPGEKIGLVGHSGAGKSTFIKLLARYFDIQNGSIKINGIDIRDIAQDSLHKNIATIPQDVSLFNRPLLENIRYGKVTAADEEVFKAAEKANADGFISSFPDGYRTIVGERGVVLSGGERQRIAIARTILKNAPILIFDEATSALDSQSEKYIQESLKELMKNKTVIAVAHRLSTLREMDRIVVFDKGKIIEHGTHSSLIRKKGKYYNLYKMQTAGFLSE